MPLRDLTGGFSQIVGDLEQFSRRCGDWQRHNESRGHFLTAHFLDDIAARRVGETRNLTLAIGHCRQQSAPVIEHVVGNIAQRIGRDAAFDRSQRARCPQSSCRRIGMTDRPDLPSSAVVNGLGQIAFLVERRDQHAVFVVEIAGDPVFDGIISHGNRRGRRGCWKYRQRGRIGRALDQPSGTVILETDNAANRIDRLHQSPGLVVDIPGLPVLGRSRDDTQICQPDIGRNIAGNIHLRRRQQIAIGDRADQPVERIVAIFDNRSVGVDIGDLAVQIVIQHEIPDAAVGNRTDPAIRVILVGDGSYAGVGPASRCR